MNDRTVRARRVVVTVRADDTEDAVRVVRNSEAALRRALDGVADEAGEGFLVVRRVELTLGVDMDGDLATVESLERVLGGALRRRLKSLREQSEARRIADDAAWFESRAAAAAACLIAEARGEAGAWPYRSLPFAGLGWVEVLERCAGEGDLFFADVLGQTARTLTRSEMAKRTPPDVAARLLSPWIESGKPLFNLAELPDDVRRALAAPDALLEEAAAGSPTARLAWLARLFSLWPPARASSHEFPSPAEYAQRKALESTAGGLVLWARLLDGIGFLSALEAAYPTPRVRRAALWALGRALEAPQVSAQDPLLLAWSGEEPGSKISAAQTLAESDPEPLHRLALRLALEQKWNVAAVRALSAAGAVHALSPEDILVDTLEGVENVHEAVPHLVQRFTARTGLSPTAVEVRMAASSDIDAIRDVDVPALPDAWRPAVRAAASVARCALLKLWRAAPRQARGWFALVAANEVRIRRSDATRIADAAWVGDGRVRLRDTVVSIALE